jgi:xylose isomerase
VYCSANIAEGRLSRLAYRASMPRSNEVLPRSSSVSVKPFDAKIRRQSLDPADLVLAHVGGMDVCARALKSAARMLEDGKLEALRDQRYAGWSSAGARAMLDSEPLEAIAARVAAGGINPEPKSGRQERIENLINSYL